MVEMGCEWNVNNSSYVHRHNNLALVTIAIGTYFGTHFIMGGERFDTPQPEAYLFGENGDLNFLGSRPTAVRMLIRPLSHTHTYTLQLYGDFRMNVLIIYVPFFGVYLSFHIRRHKRTNQPKH